jgi:hypothetical protein
LRLNQLQGRIFHVQESCATNGDGLPVGLVSTRSTSFLLWIFRFYANPLQQWLADHAGSPAMKKQWSQGAK